MRQTLMIPVKDSSQVAVARRAAHRAAIHAGLDDERANQVEIVAVELGKNLLSHAEEGRILLNSSSDDGVIEILSVDSGAGMASFEECVEDGYSTGSTPGLGLGAVRRLSQRMCGYSRPGKGTVISAQFSGGEIKTSRPGAVSVAYPGEEFCGDGYAEVKRNERTLYLMADGLGHGMFASQAAEMAIDIFMNSASDSPAVLVEQMHGPMRSTRGAAVAVVALDHPRRTVICCGVGNISTGLYSQSGVRNMVSHNGIVGHQMRRVQAFEYKWEYGDLLIMHSDGLSTHWKLSDYPGLQQAAPSLVAAVLYRDFERGRDDVSVVVADLD